MTDTEGTPVERARFIFLFFTAIGLLLFAYRHLDTLAARGHRPRLDAFLCEMTGGRPAAHGGRQYTQTRS